MVLERTPQSGNLIASEIAKCQPSVAIKRKQAIEDLRLESIKPERIINRNTSRARECKIQSSSSLNVSTVRRDIVHSKPQISQSTLLTPRCLQNRQASENRVRHKGSGSQMWKQHDLRPPPAPDPPDVSQEDPDKGVISVSGVVEERTLALELCQSQCTSTYEASTYQHPTKERL